MIAPLVLLGGCEEEWDGHVYPDKSDLTHSEYIGRFQSLEECRDAALSRINRLPRPGRGDYECGLNCEPGIGGILVCEETMR